MRFLIALVACFVASSAWAADISPNYRVPGSLTGDNFKPFVMLCPSSDGSNTMVDCATKVITTNSDSAALGLPLATTLNAAITVPTPARATFAWTYNGLTASGATLTPETSDDSGATWSTVNCVQPVTGALVTAIITDGQCRINAAARTTMRLRVSTAGTGTITVAWNASSETGLVALSAPIISRVLNTNIAYTQVTVGVTSTLLLPAAAASRSMLEATNISGRFAGTATDVWCQYGTAAVLGQGFPVFGGGGQYNRNIPAAIDLRAVNCIASAGTTINVGSVQQ